MSDIVGRRLKAYASTEREAAAEITRLRAERDAFKAEAERLREALERWAAAFKTGRNEPLVIAYETAAALQEKPHD